MKTTRTRSGNAFSIIILSFFLASAANLSQAATINVTANAPDVLNGANASCSLREAITNINNGAATFADCANAGGAYGTGDTINLAAGTYTNTIATTNEDLNANGDLDILNNVAIVGAGAGTTFIDGGGIDRVLHLVPSSKVVSISGVTIQNGSATTGGGIWNIASVTLTDSVVRANTATTGSGGITSQNGSTTLVNSVVSGNSALGPGTGGIAIFNMSPLTLINSTVSGNTTNGGIGAINVVVVPSLVNITNSTISGNAGEIGGIRLTAGTLNITNSTISGNVGDGTSAGGIANLPISPTTITLRNSIVAGNTGPECTGVIINGGNNIDDGTSCGWTNVNGSMSSTNPLLGPLALNAPGTTQTHALLPGSPAIDGVTFSSPNGAPATDQRGTVRPQGAGHDIGAFEAIGGLPPLVNGVCGSANGTIVTSAPISLCTTGSASVPANNNTSYDWSCAGSGGGTTATCSATINYLVTTSVTGGNGTISANQAVAYQATPSFTLTPAPGFVAGPVTGSCGGTLVANVFTVNAVVNACTVVAGFTAAVAGVAPAFTNPPPPSGTLGVPYSFTFTASGTGPITFSLTPGTILPPGLSLSSSGVLSGTPTSSSIGPWTGSVIAANGTLPNAVYPYSFMIPNPVVAAATVAPIPTLSEWALMLLAGLMGLLGVAAVRPDAAR